MKNLHTMTLIFLSVVLLASCQIQVTPHSSETEPNTEITIETAAETESESAPLAAPVSANNFLPIGGNVLYEYTGEGNEFAFYTMTVDYISVNMVQQRINNGGTEIVRVLKAGDGKISELMSKGEIYYRENFLKSEFNPAEEKIILMEPIEVGTAWTLADGSVKTITNYDFILITPSGTYDAVEVTTENAQGEIVGLDYFTNFGLVKSIYNPGENQVSSTLSVIRENTPAEQTVSFFYPNANDDILYYEDKIIIFNTNDETTAVLESAYKDSALGKVLSENTKINSLKIDSENILHIDLNQAFITEMSAGAMYETLILQSIVNTFGKYYNAEKVSLTIEGKNYESGHIYIEPGDLLPVDYSKAVKADE